MSKKYIEWELLFRRIHGMVSPEEEIEFRQWHEAAPNPRDYYLRMTDVWESKANVLYKTDIPKLICEFDALLDLQISHRRMIRRRLTRSAAVFALLVILGATTWLSGILKPGIPNNMEMIVPGGEKAILVLSDGQRIDVGELGEAEVVSVGRVVVKKTDGMITYEESEGEMGHTTYNTIMIPRGGEHKLLLPDGSRVWLNSETSLTFPVGRVKGIRSIWLSGEAYFDIVHDSERPFIVHTELGDIKVHGTQFNVRYYPDKNDLKATLVNGSISYTLPGDGDDLRIEPGYQVQYRKGDSAATVQKVKLINEVAWKSDMLNFEKQPLSEIMESLARWYDIEVVFETDSMKNLTFSGSINRYEDFYSFTELFEASASIKFEIRGKQVTIKEK